MNKDEKLNKPQTQQVPHERVVSCGDHYYDKSGKELGEFDVVKVFHFIGARRKRHYMYKWIRKNSAGEFACNTFQMT